MIVFTATLILVIAAVVAGAGVATGSGSIHSLGGHFALSGHQLGGPSAGKLFVYGIVVRIAGLLGFTCCPAPRPVHLVSRGSQRALTGSRRETTARCAWTVTGSPANPSSARPAGIARPGRGVSRCCGTKQTSSSCPARRRRRALAGIQVLAERPFAGVLQRVSRPVITMASRTRGRHHPRQRPHRRACGRPQPCGRLGECRSPNRNAPR